MSRAATAAEPRRSEQGAERRAKIIAATAALVTREGIGAVTHRAVAREAGVPLAATTYYFASKDELVGEALRVLVAEEVEQLRARAAELGAAIDSPATLARALSEAVVPGNEGERRVMLAKFEIYLEAARRPGLRPAVDEWRRTFTGMARSALEAAGDPQPDATAPLLVAAIDGVLTHSLSEGIRAETEGDTRRRVAELAERIARRPDGS